MTPIYAPTYPSDIRITSHGSALLKLHTALSNLPCPSVHQACAHRSTCTSSCCAPIPLVLRQEEGIQKTFMYVFVKMIITTVSFGSWVSDASTGHIGKDSSQEVPSKLAILTFFFQSHPLSEHYMLFLNSSVDSESQQFSAGLQLQFFLPIS